MLKKNEEFRTVKGYEDYLVSDLGRVYSLKRGKFLKPGTNGDGYKYVVLCKNGKQKSLSVHRLVAITFIENPEGKEEVNHKDGDKENNTVDNLEWNTHLENLKHAYETGLCKHLKKVIQLDVEGNFITEYESTIEASEKTGLSRQTISYHCNKRVKTPRFIFMES